ERVVRRDGYDPRARTNELVEVVREAGDYVVAPVFAQQRLLNDAHAGGHVLRRTIGVVFDVTPFRILSIDDAFHPDRYGRHRHLNEVTGVIDGLSQRSGKDDHAAAV